MRPLLALLTFGLLSPVMLPAQGPVSPAYYTEFRGNTSNGVPFGGGQNWPGTIRYQQIHTDLRGAPRTIRGLSFRPHRNAAPTPAGTVEIELLLGDGDRATAGRDFDSNFLGTPQVVIARKVVTVPALSGSSTPFVEPFHLTLQFDQPYVHSGAHDLVWELRTYARTGGGFFGGFYSADYAVQSTGYTVPNQAQSYSLGPDCAGAPSMSAPIATLPSGVEMMWSIGVRAPATARFGVMMFGLTNPNQPVSTIDCLQRLQTDALVAVAGPVDRSGSFFQTWVFPWQAAYAGDELYLQGAYLGGDGRVGLTGTRHIKLPPGPAPTIPALQLIGTPVTATQGLIFVTHQQVIVRFDT